jgi:23S rRNA (uracil1939-C5)-methyltransferase
LPELCRHFGTCGGCSSQDLSDEIYLARKRERVLRAFAQNDVAATLEPFVRVAEGTRRRAVFKAKKSAGNVAIGFHGAATHTIVDMRECRVLTPALFKLAGELRIAMEEILSEGESAETHVTEAENGFDLAVRWPRKSSISAVPLFARLMDRSRVVRVTANGEVICSQTEPYVRFGKARVTLPPEAFLQPTSNGERALQDLVRRGVQRSKNTADLFAGCGTLSFAIAESARVHAVEADKPMLAALAEASRHTQGLKPVTTEQRDLFRRPLTLRELDRFDCIVLDPPRAGAETQARQLAASSVGRVVYVSCDAQSFARDARILINGRFGLERTTPVDQFLWSEHIELVGVFERGK